MTDKIGHSERILCVLERDGRHRHAVYAIICLIENIDDKMNTASLQLPGK